LINDKEKATKMGCNGRKFVEKNFNWDTTAKKFVNVTKSYIKDRNSFE
jgi:glycosyltransferase involved in cell wall biosynthesis